jgi:type VI secretion system protein ImpC
LCQLENTPRAVFISAQSCQLPQAYFDDEVAASAVLSARLPNVFAASRFAHYIKTIVRDKVGLFLTKDECQNFLTRWISNYVLMKPDADYLEKAKYPLQAARIVVEDAPDRPGEYMAKVYLRPHYQLEEIAVSMMLIPNIPVGWNR